MISIIICSINKTFAHQVQENIGSTIGVVWEAIIIDNTISPKSITEVYNLGAAEAKYDLLVFVHEDVLFKTPHWGVNLQDYFDREDAPALIGIAGSKYKSSTPSGWFTGFSELDCCSITHLNSNNHQEKIYFNPVAGSQAQQVVVLDGVFLCCPKKIWAAFKFDEFLLKDFHLYDLDFSLRVAQKYPVVVVFDIDILHITKGGHYGNKWLEATLLWHKAIKQRLPFVLPQVNLKNNEVEKKILKTWLIRLKHEDISFRNKISWLYSIRIWRNIFAWPFIVLFLFKRIFKKHLRSSL
jgi:hypothetical protein